MTLPTAPQDGTFAVPGHQDPPTGPVPVVGGTGSETPAPSRPGRRWTPILLAVIGVLVVALGAVTALWISTSNQLSANESAQAAVEANRAATPDVLEVAKRNLGSAAVVSGDADSVSVVIFESGVSKAAPGLRNMLDELGFSSAVLDRMGNTRALDGTREAQGKNCNVTWTFHPDDGLQMVFEAVPPN